MSNNGNDYYVITPEGDPTTFNMTLRVLRDEDTNMFKLVKYDFQEEIYEYDERDTVWVNNTPADPDKAIVDEAKVTLEGTSYEIPLTEQSTQGTKTAYVQNEVEDTLMGVAVTATVSFNAGVYEALITKGSQTVTAILDVTEEV